MLQYSTNLFMSTEGCSNIIWKTVEKAPQAAEAMGVTSESLEELGIVDETIPEPLGGAHRDIESMAASLKSRLTVQLDRLCSEPIDQLLERRYQRSEEHTSELQSRGHLVCRLLLEKKKRLLVSDTERM